jgi:LlaMI restriction endonuclease
MSDKEKIIELFFQNVKGNYPDLSGYDAAHDGREGHWLEKKMGIKPNASNKPDLLGYEMKNNTTSKTTFGDWSANYFIYRDKEYGLNGRNDFLHIFGRPNPEKNMRYSWSGSPSPKIDGVNDYGQVLIIDADKNIHAKYFYSKDKRLDKRQIIPEMVKQENLTIAKWDKEKLQKKLERKFNQKGWFKCLKNSQGIYSEIVFGEPINYDTWIKLVATGDVIFDSGMYEGNARPYANWRSSNSFWNKLVTSKY